MTDGSTPFGAVPAKNPNRDISKYSPAPKPIKASSGAIRVCQRRSEQADPSLFLFTYFLFKKRSELSATKKDLPWLIAFGIIAVVFVQSFYFVAIERINISTTLIIEFTAPIWILIHIKFILKRHVSKAMWVALALAFSGLLMVAQIWDGLTLDSTGLAFTILTAFCLAFYFICGEKLGKSRSTGSILVWSFGVASILWAIVLPLWNFPIEYFTHNMNLLGRFSDNQLPG